MILLVLAIILCVIFPPAMIVVVPMAIYFFVIHTMKQIKENTEKIKIEAEKIKAASKNGGAS